MPQPTLQQLFGFYTDHPLPTLIDPGFQGVTVGGLSVCGDDARLQRILGFPNNPDNILFLAPNKVPSTTSLRDLDDVLLRRILTGTGGLLYRRETDGPNRTRVPEGMARLDLCRDPAPSSGSGASARYAVFATDRIVPVLTDDDIVRNAPRQPNFLDQLVGVRLTNAEIINLVRGSGLLDTSQFAVSQESPGVFFIAHNRNLANGLVRWLETDPRARELFPNGTRRLEIAQAVRATTSSDEFQFLGLQWSATWQPIVALASLLSIPVSLLATYIIQRRLMNQMQDRNEKMMRELQGDMSKVDPKSFTTDDTEKARGENYSSLVGQERVLDTLRRYTLHPDMPHVILTGPPGSGKSATMLEFFHQIATDGIAHLRGRRLLILEAGKLSAAGAIYSGLSDKALQAFVDEARRQPSVVWIREAHQLVSVGLHSGNQTSGALDRLKAVMEDPNSGITFILDSDRTRELMADAAIARRTQVVVNERPRYSDVLSVMEGYSKKYARDFKIQFEAESLRAVTLLADYKAGAAPSCQKLVMGNLVADARMRGAETISLNDVVRVVAYESRRPESTVRNLLQQRTLDPQLAEDIWAEPYVRHASENEIDSPDRAPRDPSTRAVTNDPATPPVVPAATGSGVTGIFTEDSFYEMFRSRYPQFQNEAGQVHGNYEVAVRAMARLAFNRWSADPAHPTTTVDGHVFPRESFVEQTFRDAIRISAERDAAQATELRRVYEAGRERLGEGRRLDTTSEPFRAEGLRAFEAIGR